MRPHRYDFSCSQQNQRRLTHATPHYMGNSTSTGTRAYPGSSQYIMNHRCSLFRNPQDFSVSTTSTPIVAADGEMTRIIGISSAMTKREQPVKELQNSDKAIALETLIGGIAHEFNNILSIIIGNAELAISDTPSSNPVARRLEDIQNASLRAKDVVKSLLTTVLKTDEIPCEELDLVSVVRKSTESITGSLPDRVTICFNTPCQAIPILANETDIRNFLVELVKNSVNFMTAGPGTIEVDLTTVSIKTQSEALMPDLRPGHYARLRVKDTGKGINPEIIDRVFDPYFTTRTKFGALGMGLAVTRGVVKQTGGDIVITSVLGEGTTVEVYLPIVEQQADTSEPVETAPLSTGTEHILLIDDNEVLLSTISDIFSCHGYRVTLKTNPLDALESFKSAPYSYDLVLSDLNMPEMSGRILFNEIRSIRMDIPFLLCSGDFEPAPHHDFEDSGRWTFLSKPLDIDNLLTAARCLLDTPQASADGQIGQVTDTMHTFLTAKQEESMN